MEILTPLATAYARARGGARQVYIIPLSSSPLWCSLLFPGSSITRHHFSPTYPSYLPIPCPSHFSLLSCTFFDISPTFCPSNSVIPYSVQLGDSTHPSQHPYVHPSLSVVLQSCIVSPQVDSSVKQNPPIHSSNLFILALLYTLSLLPSLRFKLQTG